MCLQCSNHCPEQENEPSKDELWTLFRAAYEQYQSEIVNDSKLYDRYVNDFISYHLPVFSQEEESIRNHFKNLFSIYELLTTRKDLVEKFFKLPEFEKKDFLEMVHSFNHIEYVVETPHSLATFNENQIRLITQFANESNFFVETVDERTVDLFFSCKLKRPLVVQNMRHVLQFMFALSMQKNLLFLIEAVHSTGPMDEIRVMKLKKQMVNCTATPIFVTTFLNKKEFRKWVTDIAWESEVWIADNPEHMIHFNGYKFLEIHKE